MPYKPTGRAPGRPRTYDWPTYFKAIAGSGQVSIPRADWGRLDGETMRRRVLAEARRRGVKVATELREDKVVVKAVLRHRDYPWDEWLAGHQQRLVPGKDFTCSPEVFRGQAYRAARARGLRVRTTTFQGAFWIQGLSK